MIVVSFDPGLTGACAVLDHNGLRAVFDIPTMQIPGAGPQALVQRKVDAHALCRLLLEHCPAGEGKPHVVMESVRAMGGKNNSVQTQGSLLRTLGALEAVVECLGWAPVYVEPRRWKAMFGLGPDKKQSLEVVRKLYPDSEAYFRRVRDHNRSESVLIGHWYMRTVA